MPPAGFFLLFGVALATVLGVLAVWRRRPRRSPQGSVDEFQRALRAIAPRRRS